LSAFWYLYGIRSAAKASLLFASGTLTFVTPRPVSRRPLPGRQPLPKDFIAQHQRARIVAALAEETARRGYRQVTIAHIVRRAGIARNTFYENFSSKEDCFLAAQKMATSEALNRVVATAGEVEGWPERVEAGLAAFLRYVASEPALARTCMVEALAAGPAAVEGYEEALQSFVSLFRLGRDFSDNGAELPETLEEAVIGGVFWIIYHRIFEGKAETVEQLLPDVVDFALIPYLGGGRRDG
jgi:AcrR family transcriptional regulator